MQLTDSLFLFKALIKAGCTWQGDVSHRKWSEQLHFSEAIRDKIVQCLAGYDEGNDYLYEGCTVWIA